VAALLQARQWKISPVFLLEISEFRVFKMLPVQPTLWSVTPEVRRLIGQQYFRGFLLLFGLGPAPGGAGPILAVRRW
jgi:hypothetical protein